MHYVLGYIFSYIKDCTNMDCTLESTSRSVPSMTVCSDVMYNNRSMPCHRKFHKHTIAYNKKNLPKFIQTNILN